MNRVFDNKTRKNEEGKVHENVPKTRGLPTVDGALSRAVGRRDVPDFLDVSSFPLRVSSSEERERIVEDGRKTRQLTRRTELGTKRG